MFKTLKVRIDQPAQMGNPRSTNSVQTQNSTVARQVSGQNGRLSTIKASDAIVATRVAVHNSGSVQRLSNPTLGSLIDMVINDPNVIMPQLGQSKFNTLRPNVAADKIMPSKVALVSLLPRKIEPYEQLTGLSTDRPEIIMSTQFQPLYKRDGKLLERYSTRFVEESGRNVYHTPAGNYVDTQYQLMHLRNDNVERLIRSVRQSDASLHSDLHRRSTDVFGTLSELQETARFLTAVLENVSLLRNSLDLQSGFHVIDPINTISTHITAFHKRNDQSTNSIFDLAKRFLPVSYTPADCLVRLGYQSKNVGQLFTSTKVWMQTMEELRRILRNHSLEFIDIDTVSQRNDSSSTSINTPAIDYFDMRDTLPQSLGVQSLKNLKVPAVSQTLNDIETAYRLLYTGVHFKTEEARLAAIIKLLSNEFKYSIGLSQLSTQRLLKEKFDFSVADVGNTNLFDAVIGVAGASMLDAPETRSPSLMGFAQIPSSSIVVLPFESRFLEAEQGIASPGGQFYVDELFNVSAESTFNTSRLEDLVRESDDRVSSFRAFIDAFNIGSHNFVAGNDKSLTSIVGQLSTPFLLSDFITLTFLDKDAKPLKLVKNDPATSIFALAHTDIKIRSILFLHVLSRLTRAYVKNVPFGGSTVIDDNTPVTVNLMKKLQTLLHQTLPPTTRAPNPRSTGDIIHIAPDAVTSSLIAHSGLTEAITDLMVSILTAFNDQNMGMIDGKTRFSAFHDTVILMATFDAICSIIAQFCGQSLVGISSGRPSNDKTASGVDYFVVAIASPSPDKSRLEAVTSRLEKEEALTRQLVYAALGVPYRLSSAIKIQLGFFGNSANNAKLGQVAAVLDDRQFFKMFFTEQQIRLFVSEAFDYSARSGAGSSTTDSNEIKTIDDSLLSPKVREILDNVFFEREFSIPNAVNKRILTVGLPNGLMNKIQQRVVASTGARPDLNNDRRSTVISVTVHRIDLERPDIVFKPKKVLFDAATFMIREDSKYLELIRSTSDPNEALYAIPFRDLGPGGNEDAEFAVSRPGDSGFKGRKLVFTGPDYAFLQSSERDQMIKNHVMSFLLEAYLRLTTGVHVSENVFKMAESPNKISSTVSSLIMAARAQQAVSSLSKANVSTQGALFHVNVPPAPLKKQTGVGQPDNDHYANASGNHGHVSVSPPPVALSKGPNASKTQPSNTVFNVSQAVENSSRVVESVTHDLRSVQHLQLATTTLSEPDSIIKHLIVPKQFDRVFNIIIDPNEFEIDVSLMSQSPHGRDALAQNINMGTIVTLSDLSTVKFSAGDSTTQRYKHVERDTNEGDLIFDKYFVAIETYDELKDEAK